jgi:hypothetical protein
VLLAPVPPGRPGFARGAVVHVAISLLCGETPARTLCRDHSAAWGGAAGLVIGAINVGVIRRSFPAISDLPLVPQLADNVMFGTVFAVVLDRRDPHHGDHGLDCLAETIATSRGVAQTGAIVA